MVIITTATVVGNVAVMVALWRVRRAPSHYPLISLVTADLLVGILIQPLAAMRELYVFKLNNTFCSCWSTLDVLCSTASILSLCVLGWERWSGITSPLTRALRARRVKLLSGLVWPVAVSIALPDAFIPSPKHFHPGELDKACEVNTNPGYVFFSVTLSFYLPATVMIMLYGFILRALSLPPQLRAHRGRSPYLSTRDSIAINSEFKSGQEKIVRTDEMKLLSIPWIHCAGARPIALHEEESKQCLELSTQLNVAANACHSNVPATVIQCTAPTTGKCSIHANFITRQRRATRMIVMLMILFLMCWTPYFVILPLDSLYDCVNDATWFWCSWLGYANSSLNPLVYAAASPAVREALRSSLTSVRNTELQLTPRRK